MDAKKRKLLLTHVLLFPVSCKFLKVFNTSRVCIVFKKTRIVQHLSGFNSSSGEAVEVH